MRLTIACPEGLIEEANAALAEAFGDGYAGTFGDVIWQTADGTKYAVCSGEFQTETLPEPFASYMLDQLWANYEPGHDGLAVLAGMGLAPVVQE